MTPLSSKRPTAARATGGDTPRALLVLPGTSYRAAAFVEAAERLGVDLWLASDLAGAFTRFGNKTLSLADAPPEVAARVLASELSTADLHAVLGTDERTAVIAAELARRLDLRGNHPAGVAATANKPAMRDRLSTAGVPGPDSAVLEPEQGAETVVPSLRFPCVVKPAMLSGSQGVIRADDAQSFLRAVARIRALLDRHPSPARETRSFHRLLVETYLPGREVAVEGLVRAGELEVLAIFDKPDELVGPYFEETLYVTPSRLPQESIDSVITTTAAAARALGIVEGPLHAELRVEGDHAGVLEVAARSIGGLCSRSFEFVLGNLEERLLAHALGLPDPPAEPPSPSAGVMMIPIPRSGVLRTVDGVDRARAVDGVDDVRITVSPGQAVRALPEGASYLGFLFAHGPCPERVEQSLRAAHAKLQFCLSPLLT